MQKIHTLLKKCRKNLSALEPRLAKAKGLALKLREQTAPSLNMRLSDSLVMEISNNKNRAAMHENELDGIESELNRVLTRNPENEKFLEGHGFPRHDPRNEVRQLLERALSSQHNINLLGLKIASAYKKLKR